MGPVAAAVSPFIPVMMGALGIGASMYQGRKAEKRAEKNMEQWQQISKPDPKALEAAARQNRGQLAQGRLGAYQNLISNMAARGFGSGSGLMVEQASKNIEGPYLKALGQSADELTKFGLTPMFGPPSSAFATTGGWESALGKGGDMMDTAMGYYTMKNLLGGSGGGSNTYNFSRTY